MAPPVRRARTAAGAVPPQIALDVTRVTACAQWVARTLGCCESVSVSAVVDHILPMLSVGLTRDLRSVVLDAAAEFAAAHVAAHEPPRRSFPDVPRALAQVYDGAQAVGTLDETVADLVARCIDGERVTWEVIGRESVKHEGLIHKECNRLVRTLPERSTDELTGYGWTGLRVALRNFEPNLGFAFSTYACPKINGAIRDGVRAESPIPKRLTTFMRKISKAEEQLTHELSRVPTYAEIAEFIDSSTAALLLIPRLSPTASIEEMSNPWGEHTREPACLVDAADPQEAAVTALRNAALHLAIGDLPAADAQAVRLLVLEEMPVGEAAALVGVEPRQLRLRKQRALRSLEPVMRAWMDENALACV